MNLRLQHDHAWEVSPTEAIAVQTRLAPLVQIRPLAQSVHTIAGVDMSVRGDQVQAAVVVVEWPTFQVVDKAVWRGPVQFPYVPGLLSFREAPAVLQALEQLEDAPDLLLCDAQGRAHPRRFGLACHLGVLLDWPCIGVAKSRLTGQHAEVGLEKGEQTPLLATDDATEVIGTVLRTRRAVRPVYVSMGHNITLNEATDWTLACATRYRLPEPTRLAHLASRRAG